jgi:hypothetical protein
MLELFPGSGQAMICCRLLHCDLQGANNNYEALSYAWENATRNHSIICDDRKLEVTASLKDALQAIRDPINPKLVWADAICINQDDDNEKSQQVAVMDRIYEYARSVTVWLGRDTEGISSDCFDLIRQTNRHLDELLDKYGDVSDIPTITQPCPIPFDQSIWNKVVKMMKLPWFKRVWVIQEAALARRCDLIWGSHRLDIAELCEVSLWLDTRAELPMKAGTGTFGGVFLFGHCTYENSDTWRTTLPLIKHRHNQVKMYKWSLLHLLDTASELQASFGVDRIYAFLGNPLARKAETGGLGLMVQPDYTKSEDEVYFEAACEMLRDTRNASYVLPFISHWSNQDLEDKSMPSWVPRWDKRKTKCTIANPNYWYHAGGRSNTFEAQVRRDKALVTVGVVFDRIAWTSTVLERHNFGFNKRIWDEDYSSTDMPWVDFIWEELVKFSSRSPGFGGSENELDDLEAMFAITLVRGFPTEDFDEKLESRWISAREEFSAYRWTTRFHARSRNTTDSSEQSSYSKACSFLHELNYTHLQRICRTDSGRLGLVSGLTRSGDVCCVLPGVQAPMILRPMRGETYRLVCDAYIHGVMGGEMVEHLEEGKANTQEIIIV